MADALVYGSGSILQSGHLLKKINFPAEVLVLSRLASVFFLQALGLTVLAVLLVLLLGVWPHPGYAVLAFVYQTALLLGPVFLLAALSTFFRDIVQVLPSILAIILYLTPILYPESSVPAKIAPWMAVNPLRDAIGLFRAAFSGGPPPPLSRVAFEGAVSLLLLIAGLRFFRRCRPTFADAL